MKTSIYADQFAIVGDGFPNAQPWTSGQIVNTPTPAYEANWVLTVGSNQLAVPPGTLWMKVISGPSGAAKTWRGGTIADAGTRMHPTYASTFWFDPLALPATVYITATANETVYVVCG
jgi:hypothetical protein